VLQVFSVDIRRAGRLFNCNEGFRTLWNIDGALLAAQPFGPFEIIGLCDDYVLHSFLAKRDEGLANEKVLHVNFLAFLELLFVADDQLLLDFNLIRELEHCRVCLPVIALLVILHHLLGFILLPLNQDILPV